LGQALMNGSHQLTGLDGHGASEPEHFRGVGPTLYWQDDLIQLQLPLHGQNALQAKS